MKLSNNDLQDIWSALAVWLRHIDKIQNPKTAKDIEKLIKKIRKEIKREGAGEL